MPYISIASFNIEKNGQSSELLKQQKVSDFIDYCSNRAVDLIFLCEVHSARIGDYISHLREVYGENYACEFLEGGHSNAYVLLARRSGEFHLSFDGLRGLNRNFLLCHIDDKVAIGFAHFKSGQTGQTRGQIEEGAAFMDTFTNGTGRWAITGDMNWDLNRFNQLTLPGGVQRATSWGHGATQKNGGILDWCLAGSGVQLAAADGPTEFNPAFQVMDGPDHRPVLFQIGY